MSEVWRQVAHNAWHAPSWREAAEKYREDCPNAEIPPDRLSRFRALRAPSTLIEALVLSLRCGVTELIRPETQRRLSALDKHSLEAVCLRVQAFRPTTAAAWCAEDADLLISAWKKLHEQC